MSVFTYNDFGDIDTKFYLNDYYDLKDLLELGLYGVKVREGEINLKKALDYIENIAFNPAKGAREDVPNMVYLLSDLPEEVEYRRIEQQLNSLIDKDKNTLLVTNGEVYQDISNIYNLELMEEYSRAIESLLIFACNDAEEENEVGDGSDYDAAYKTFIEDDNSFDYSDDKDVDSDYMSYR